MASSGVRPEPYVVEKFNKLKLRKEYGYLLLRVVDGRVEIFEEGKKNANKEDFVAAVAKETDCCFGIFDGRRVAIFAWNPDTARAKSKMLMASSADAITCALEGVGQAIGVSDVEELEEKLMQKNLV